jgi:2'-5' RNA ligase
VATIGVAIPIAEPFGSELQKHRAEFGDPMAASIPTHVTLLPPTEIADDALAAIDEHLLAVAEGISSCEVLQSQVRSGPLAVDLRFPYHPHVTVAHDLDKEALDRAYDTLSEYDCAFDVPAFDRYEHGADGVWRPQRSFPLAG